MAPCMCRGLKILLVLDVVKFSLQRTELHRKSLGANGLSARFALALGLMGSECLLSILLNSLTNNSSLLNLIMPVRFSVFLDGWAGFGLRESVMMKFSLL